MNVIPKKKATNVHKNMTSSSHIPRGMQRHKKYDLCQSYNTSTKNITTQSHMPRRIGIFSAWAGLKRARTPMRVKACPTCCWDRRFCPLIRPDYRIYPYD